MVKMPIFIGRFYFDFNILSFLEGNYINKANIVRYSWLPNSTELSLFLFFVFCLMAFVGYSMSK